MPRPLIAQFLTPLTDVSKRADAQKSARRQRAAQFAAKTGPPGLAEQLNPLQASAWTLERQKRQSAVRSKYFSDKRIMRREKLRAQEKMRRGLLRRKAQIETRYNLDDLKPVDPRYDRASRLASLRYGQRERETHRQHLEQWQRRARSLRNAKSRQYRAVTQEMKKQYRREHGLPEGLQAPWKI